MKTVDFENHFATEMWVDALSSNKGYPRLVDDPKTHEPRLWHGTDVWQPLGLLGRLLNLDQGRIREMDVNGVDVAVLSLTPPGPEQLGPAVGSKVARDSNNVLSEAVRRHSDRFIGFATLASRDTEVAVAELERCVRELGFRGWYTTSSLGGSYLDEKRYWPLLGKAEELGIPIYIHPTVPLIPQMRTYGFGLAGPTFGFGTEAALAMMRLIVSGVFDAFPRLQIILGHLGEGLPFLLDRVDRAYLQGHVQPDAAVAPVLERRPSYYLRRNLTVSTSGNYLSEAFECTKKVLGIERIVLGTDYPYENVSDSLTFLADQPLTMSERATLFEGNAQRLGVVP